MKIKKQALSLVVVLGFIFFIVSILFYWFQIRPENIKGACYDESLSKMRDKLKPKYGELLKKEIILSHPEYKDLYKNCLHFKGLE